MFKTILNLDCHVRSGADAVVFVSVNQINYKFDLIPTINWVPSSSPGPLAHRISMDIELTIPVANTNTYEIDLEIKAEGSDVLVCGYSISRGRFQISRQPVWDEAGWQPYDISGHYGDDTQFQGNGSLQILDGQTVEFGATITMSKFGQKG